MPKIPKFHEPKSGSSKSTPGKASAHPKESSPCLKLNVSDSDVNSDCDWKRDKAKGCTDPIKALVTTKPGIAKSGVRKDTKFKEQKGRPTAYYTASRKDSTASKPLFMKVDLPRSRKKQLEQIGRLTVRMTNDSSLRGAISYKVDDFVQKQTNVKLCKKFQINECTKRDFIRHPAPADGSSHEPDGSVLSRGIPVRLVPDVILGHENMKILKEQLKVFKTIKM